MREKIWITSKTRMNAERRLRRYDRLSHLLVSYYSLLLILLFVFSDEIFRDESLSQRVGLGLSIAVFVLTLILHGFHFGSTADKFRDCYLKLQKLLSQDGDVSDQYDDILQYYPNHEPRDYYDLIVRNWLDGSGIIQSTQGGPAVVPSRLMIVEYFMRRATFVAFGYAVHFIWPIWAACVALETA